MKDESLDLGLMAEGIVELDPMTDRLVIRCGTKSGGFQFVDVQEQLLQHKGMHVRFILTPMETISRLARMVEEGQIAAHDVPKVPRLT